MLRDDMLGYLCAKILAGVSTDNSLSMKHTMFLFHMDMHRSAGYSDGDHEICLFGSYEICCFMWCNGFEGFLVQPCNVERLRRLRFSPCAQGSCPYVCFAMNVLTWRIIVVIAAILAVLNSFSFESGNPNRLGKRICEHAILSTFRFLIVHVCDLFCFVNMCVWAIKQDTAV